MYRYRLNLFSIGEFFFPVPQLPLCSEVHAFMPSPLTQKEHFYLSKSLVHSVTSFIHLVSNLFN